MNVDDETERGPAGEHPFISCYPAVCFRGICSEVIREDKATISLIAVRRIALLRAKSALSLAEEWWLMPEEGGGCRECFGP